MIILALVTACFVLSGFAALLYQTAWMRLFAIAFGTSELSVAIVLAGYMAGLGIGALAISRFVNRVRRPVLVYAVLEGAIALFALAMPFLVDVTGIIYAEVAGGHLTPPDANATGQPLFYVVASILILLVPTGLMGATLPLLARYAVTSDRNLGSRISMLYSLNTLGAVGGTLVAGFVLLPALGLRGTVWVGVLVNGLVFVLAALLSRPISEGKDAPEGENRTHRLQRSLGMKLILPLIAASGCVSFVYEVLWTRMLSHVIGSSVYAFATMLAAFLTGIALGSAMAGGVSRRPRQGLLAFSVCQLGIALASALVYSRLEGWQPSSVTLSLVAFAVILPSTLFIGASWPLAVRAHARGSEDAGTSSAVVYVWNTAGSILGALAAAFVVIPALGFAGTARLAVLLNIAIGFIAALCLLQRRRYGSWLAPCAAGVLLVLAIAFFQPERPNALVTRPLFGGSGEQTLREVHYAVGRSSTVYLTENAARFDLMTNGLPEAQVEFLGAPPILLSQRWLGLWPSLARPDAKSVLVVGLGGGVVLEYVPPRVETLHVVELESEVVRANTLIGERRVRNPLSEERVRVVVNDARNALRLTTRRYDAIVSQPSHPWTPGASHLFSREFFALAKSRLTGDGVLVQWMNAELVDESLLRSLAATLLSEFGNVRIYQPSALALHFLASDGALDLESRIGRDGRPILDAMEEFSDNTIHGPTDVMARLLLDEKGVRALAVGASVITDDDNRMAMDAVVGATGLDLPALTEITAPLDPLLDPTSWLRRELDDTDYAYLVWRLLRDGQAPRVERLLETIPDHSLKQLLQALLHRYEGRFQLSNSLLVSIAPSDALYEQARFLLIVERLHEVANGAIELDAFGQFLSPSSRLRGVLRGWRALGQQDWAQLHAMDDALLEVHTNDLWSPQAAQLRAEWRFRARDADGDFAREALRLVDRSIALLPTTDAYVLRARLGLKMGDRPIFIESVAFLVGSVWQRVWALEYAGLFLDQTEYEYLHERLSFFLEELAEVDDGDSASERARVVSGRVEELLAALDASP